MTPGNRPERLARAAQCGADALVFDLEDGVPPQAKEAARATVARALADGIGSGHERCVRINGPDSPLAAADVAALPWAHVDALMVPKVESAAQLRRLDDLLRTEGVDRGRDEPLPLIVTLETPRGLLNALAIAESSSRVSALFFGSGDYTAACGAAVSDTTLHWPRSVIVAAAAAVGAQAIDAAFFADVKNAEATRRDARVAREFGFAGKVVFHPVQVAVVNELFSPTAAELARARALIAAHRASLARGHGTAVADGQFVAIDLVPPAERLLRLAERIAERERAGGG
jgi:citrate lyase beta subunit